MNRRQTVLFKPWTHHPLVVCLVTMTLCQLSSSHTAVALAGDGEAAVPQPPAQAPQASLRNAHVQPGYSLQLVAAEPLVADPVAIDWGADGRLWVAEMADYPYGIGPRNLPGGRVRYLDDTNGDGVYDRSVLFLDGISFPTAVMSWRDGVLIAAAPEIFFAKDTDGDGKADYRQSLLTGFMEGNQQLRVNGLRFGLDNWVYCAGGGHHAGFGADNFITVAATNARIALGSRDFRFDPTTQQLVPQSGPSQFGRVRNDWGDWFGVQNSHPLWHYVLEDDNLSRNPHGRYGDMRQQLRTPANPAVFPVSPPQKRFHSFQHSGHYTSACGPCIYRDRQLFAATDVTHAFTCEPFHNVVQHHELIDDGVSFRGQRAATLAEYDFFASSDRWCRPVMARTGPDGALWIVDMYRYMIEHPDWLPPEGRNELKPYFRSGEGMGRIYRVFRTTDQIPLIPNLMHCTRAELVDQLANSNGTIRDLAQRLLIEAHAIEQFDSLQRMLATHPSPLARLHALATLDGLSLLSDQHLIGSLADPHPLVRRHVLRIISRSTEIDSKLSDAILQLADDPSAKVRLQLIVALGNLHGDRAAELLLSLTQHAAGDRFIRAALVSSAPNHLQALVDRFHRTKHKSAEMLAVLMELTADKPRLSARLLRSGLPTDAQTLDADNLGDCERWLAALRDRGQVVFEWSSLGDDEMSSAIDELDEFMMRAWDVALNSDRSDRLRATALTVAQHDRPRRRQEHRPALVELLCPHVPSNLQLEAARILIRDVDVDTINAIYDAWPSFLPQTRGDVLDQLWANSDAIQLLLDRIESGAMSRNDFDTVRRDRLLHHPDTPIAERARDLFSSAVSTNRAEVLDRFQISTLLSGNARRGAELFAKHCATCHATSDGSPSIGPDLRSLTDQSATSLLVSILDPSRTVEPRYLGYHVETRSGQVLFGLISGENGNSLSIRTPEGPTRQLVRESIENLESSQRSFMPDGFEAELDPQNIADIIAHIQQLD